MYNMKELVLLAQRGVKSCTRSMPSKLEDGGTVQAEGGTREGHIRGAGLDLNSRQKPRLVIVPKLP